MRQFGGCRASRAVTNFIVVKPRLTPSDLKKKIEEALVRTAELDAKNIVEVDGGMVTLKGTVRFWAEKEERRSRPGQRPASSPSITASRSRPETGLRGTYVGWVTGFEPATSGATVRRSAAELHPPSRSAVDRGSSTRRASIGDQTPK
jgi:hypothetical protein